MVSHSSSPYGSRSVRAGTKVAALLGRFLWHTFNHGVNYWLQKKRGRPATGETPRVGVRLPKATRGALEAFITGQPEPRPSKSEAIRQILTDWLQERGYLKTEYDTAAVQSRPGSPCMTQPALAAHAGIGLSTVVDFERSRRTVSQRRSHRYAPRSRRPASSSSRRTGRPGVDWPAGPRFQMALDRGLQRDILRALAEKFPQYSRLKDVYPQGASQEVEIYNLHYLLGHGLVEVKTPDTTRVPPARITSAGLDFLTDDGGLTAILGWSPFAFTTTQSVRC